MRKHKYTVAVDFDGVLARYDGWKGEDVLGEPLEGAMDFLRALATEYDIVIHSTRDSVAIRQWIQKYGLDEDGDCDFQLDASIEISQEKPLALLYIDDRAFCFQGKFPTIDEIKTFRPWWQARQRQFSS